MLSIDRHGKAISENVDNGRHRQNGHEHLRPERVTESEGNLVRFAHRSDEPVIVQLWWKNSRNSRSNASEQGARRPRRTVLSVLCRGRVRQGFAYRPHRRIPKCKSAPKTVNLPRNCEVIAGTESTTSVPSDIARERHKWGTRLQTTRARQSSPL